jgi:anti-anti-sigma factor
MPDSAPQTFSAVVEEDGVLRLAGEMDLHAIQNVLGHPLVDLVDTASDVIVDMAGLTFLDSFGLSELVRIAQRMENGQRLRLRNPSPQSRRVLDLTRVDTFPAIVIE